MAALVVFWFRLVLGASASALITGTALLCGAGRCNRGAGHVHVKCAHCGLEWVRVP